MFEPMPVPCPICGTAVPNACAVGAHIAISHGASALRDTVEPADEKGTDDEQQ